jgi:hypothetical protein
MGYLFERESVRTNAIVTWFYPGTSGQEFVYSTKSKKQELAEPARNVFDSTLPHWQRFGG